MGCTSGGLIDERVILLFKNMDITGDDEHVVFFSDDNIAAICSTETGNEKNLGRKTSLGLSRKGVFIGGLDHHVDYEPISDGNQNKISLAYMTVLREAESFDDAYRLLRLLFEHEKIGVPDMLILSGAIKDGFVISVVEYDPTAPQKWGVKKVDKGHLVATNYPLTLPNPSLRENDPDSYIRLETAHALLTSDPSLQGIQNLLRSHENGPGQKSICRHREWIPQDDRTRYHKGMYNTAASVIFQIDRLTGEITARYIVKKNPCEQDQYDVKHLWGMNF